MAAAEFDLVPKTVAFASSGKVSLRRDFALPFLTAVNDELARNGFHDLDTDSGYEFLDTNFEVPPSFFSPRSSAPAAVFGADDLAIGVFIFIGTALGDWAVGKIADEVFGRWIKPHLAILRRSKEGKDTQPPATVPFNMDIWFDGSKVGVSVKTELSETNDEGVQAIIREAMSSAAAWSAQNDARGKQLSFGSEDGKPMVPTVNRL